MFTGADIQQGQEVFLSTASWNTGAFGVTALIWVLTTAPSIAPAQRGDSRYDRRGEIRPTFAQLLPDEQIVASAEVGKVLEVNRYDPASRTLLYTPGEVAAFRTETVEWSDYFTKQGGAPGLPASYIKDPTELQALTAFFAWAAWAASANRPGKDYSYTNNWPYDPLVGNRPLRRGLCLECHESHHPPGRVWA